MLLMGKSTTFQWPCSSSQTVNVYQRVLVGSVSVSPDLPADSPILIHFGVFKAIPRVPRFSEAKEEAGALWGDNSGDAAVDADLEEDSSEDSTNPYPKGHAPSR